MRRTLLATVLAALAVWLAGPAAAQTPGPATVTDPALVQQGRRLFLNGCQSCHGLDARGVERRGPTLVGAGEASADFYLRTGRMPAENSGDQGYRADPAYSDAEIRALTAYVGSLGPGPPLRDVRPERGDLAEGRKAFTQFCAGCHQIGARGGVVTGARAPSLGEATPEQVYEAIRVGPYVMPRWDATAISDDTVDSIARYVQLTQHRTDNAGGWGIGNIGPVPEGMIAWLLAIAALLVVARIVGERTR